MAEEIKIGLLGLGNVGTGVYKILLENGREIFHREGLELKVEKILVKNVGRKRAVNIEQGILTDSIDDITDNPEISIVAEFMGGVDPAREYILKALKNKKTVVTANKEVMAKHWHELERVAGENGVGLYYEASVAGGIPVINCVRESLQANKIDKIMGIINGTTNYILTKMSDDGRAFNDVLADAQRLGYAEPDPTADIEAYDAMYKLSILSSIAFHTRVHIDNVYREGITGITVDDINYGKELGYAIRLLAIAKKRGKAIETRVHPTFIPLNHPLAAVKDSFNAVFINGDAVGDLMLYGRGAGDMPTGSAIVSDIIAACRNRGRHRYSTFYNESVASEDIVFDNNWETEFFVRLTVEDRPGVLARIAGIFGKYGVSIASVIQKGHNMKEVPLIFVTHKAKELSLKNAVADIALGADVVRVENVIRVESGT
ncbi:homoserine dehydrogenase [Anaerobacterium chartisolvens]|uniref:Homoserine dehydrogenase n=1 Tax=Anaerobacterium chartisolvens TaxID=1297424 RepID=A0A369BCW9_9FIRM|nr:homoserine dehydrogenase [Anaerobacterium chartisolvens]RCX19400.1 homoserine dehydrogenase [Anaerobacterium chartisolvens]